jgi:2-polyprenyl-3-methyl-5-hydroxy-6-metoxy-1,4-benzoquinol methylase
MDGTAEQLGSVARCKICDSEATFLCNTYNEHSQTRTISNYRCLDCGTVFVGNEITREELAVAYSTLNVTSYYNETREETERKTQRALADLQRMGVAKDSAVLDIGTGNGKFLQVLDDAGFNNITGHEIPGASVPLAAERGIHVYQDFDYRSVPSSSLDCVTLLDVAEHVIDPAYLFSQCNRVLKNGAVMYFHTPVVTRTDRFMHHLQSLPVLDKIGRVWQRGRTSVFHLQNYTPKSIELLLSRSGFDDYSIAVENELSWPVSRYVRVYVCEKQRLPKWVGSVVTPLCWPLLATEFFNANKAIVAARKRGIQTCGAGKPVVG